MEFRILGPLEVYSDGQALDLGGAKQRALLAVLLLHSNQVVSRDRLVDALWDSDPPASAQKGLQMYVSGLRKLLGKDRLETRPPGYLLRVSDDEFDLERFRDLQNKGRLDEALALWRGPPLPEFGSERFAEAEIARLQELRLACLENRIDADLAAGLHVELVAELEALVKDHPLREHLRGQLMLALYRSGRQAEALDVYTTGRHRLIEELGLEPGRALHELHGAILRQDEALNAPSSAEVYLAPPVRAVEESPGPLEHREEKPAVPGREVRKQGSGRSVFVRGQRWLVAAGALLLAASFSLVLEEALGGGGGKPITLGPNMVGAIDASTDKVIAATPVGDTPTSVALGDGAVWVLNSGEETLSRIDPKSHKILKTIPAGPSPSDVALGRSSLWVANSNSRLSKIDPDSGVVVRTVKLPRTPNPLAQGRNPSWVATDRAMVWATGDGTVERVAPAPLPPNLAGVCCRGLAIGYGSVWVTDTSGVVRFDTRTGARVGRIHLPFMGADLAAGGGAIWVVDPDGNSIWVIDPRTDQVVRTIGVGNNPQGVVAGGRSVWVATASGTVVRIDPGALRVMATIRVGGTPAGIAYGEDQVWVSLD
jgi:YVTN family beta-propeller protein